MMTIFEYIESKLGGAPGGNVKCPGCGASLPLFALTRTASGWRCGHCQINAIRAVEPVWSRTWADVRGVRNELIARSDWSQLLDIDPQVREAWCAVRTMLRDITENHTDPDAAIAALLEIEATHFT